MENDIDQESSEEQGLQTDNAEGLFKNVDDLSAEPSAEPKPEDKKPLDEKLASKFAALSRKEKLVKQQQQEFQKKQSQFMQQLEEIKAENERIKKEFDNYKQGIKTSPLKALQEEGLTFEQLTDMQLNEQNPTPEMLIKRMKEEVQSEYKSEIEKLKKEREEERLKAEQESTERIINSYKESINTHLEGNLDKYELISMNEAQDLVFQVAEQFYEANGKLLSVEEAADYTEKYLEEQASKLLKAKKLNKQQPKQSSDKKDSFTLSNDLSQDSPRGTSRRLSREEEIAEAAKLLRWEQ